MTTGFIAPPIAFQGYTQNGALNAFGYVYTYQSGTLIPVATYTDGTLTTPNTNPVALNAIGQAEIWISPGIAYKFIEFDQYNNQCGYADNIVISGAPASFPQTATETAAGVIAVNQQYNSNPHDIRRYAGWNGNGFNDDSAAWDSLALVLAQGGSGIVPPGPTYIANQVVISLPAGVKNALWCYGVQIYTNNSLYGGSTVNAIDGLQITGGGNSDSFTLYGATYVQLDASCTTGFNLNLCGYVTLQDCQVLISSTVAANAGFACAKVVANAAGAGYWNKFVRFNTRQTLGNVATYAPFGILLSGAANATVIRDGEFTSVSYGIGLYASTVGTLPNGVLIDGNAFEGCGVCAVFCDGLGIVGSSILGLRITNNRGESLPGGLAQFYNFNNTYGAGSPSPPWMAGNYLVSSALPFVTNTGGASPITVNSLDYNIVSSAASAPGLGLYTNGPLALTNTASTGGLYDALDMTVQSQGGWSLSTAGGVQIASCAYNGHGATLNLAALSSYQFAGVQVVGIQQTTAVTSAAFVAGSGTAINTASTFDGYTLEQVVRALRNHGLLA